MTIMRSYMPAMPYLKVVRKDGFKNAKTMAEGPLRGAQLRKAFATLSGNPDERCSSFEAARSLVEAIGGSIDVISDSKGTLRLEIRLEIPTSDRRRDMGLQSSVAGMGFELIFGTRPSSEGSERFYVIKEGSQNRLEYADGSAKRLVRLCSSLGLKPEEKAQPCSEPSQNRAAASG